MQITDRTETRISTVVQQISRHYKRDLLWRKLVSSSMTDVLLNFEQFGGLLKLLKCRLVQDVDSSCNTSLEAMTKINISWTSLFAHLASVFSKNARVLIGTKEKHLVLLNQTNNNLFLFLGLMSFFGWGVFGLGTQSFLLDTRLSRLFTFCFLSILIVLRPVRIILLEFIIEI